MSKIKLRGFLIRSIELIRLVRQGGDPKIQSCTSERMVSEAGRK